jgi:GNAT superfamily N-acetyltransferase
MSLHLRPFTRSDDDYGVMANVRNAIFPDYPYSAAEWRRLDDKQDPKCLFARFVAEADGQALGLGHYGNMSWMYHPRKFDLGVYVHPAHQGRGVGGQIYRYLLDALAPHDPLILRHSFREDYLASAHFAASRGFVEELRAWESRLDVAAFNPAPFAAHAARVAAQGIGIHTAAELEARDADFWRRLYALDIVLGQDVPSPEPNTPPSYEQWRKWFSDPNSFLPEGFFIATDGEAYVGLSGLWRREGGSYLDTGLTGVRREYRRRGIALALKLRAIGYAQRVGAPEIRTDNESNNRGMLSINMMLGFVRQPAWISVAKVIADDRGEG